MALSNQSKVDPIRAKSEFDLVSEEQDRNKAKKQRKKATSK